MTGRLIAVALAALLVMGSVSCSSKKPEQTTAPAGYRDYLGDFAYDLPAACMVWEPVEGETDENGNPVYGLQYREIKDLDKLLSSTDTKFLLYFHSAVYGDNVGITALVEEIAERLDGRVAVISLDAAEFNDLVGKYQITLLPEFVLMGYGMEAKVFGTSDRGSWTMQEVVDWLAENGYSLSGGKSNA